LQTTRSTGGFDFCIARLVWRKQKAYSVVFMHLTFLIKCVILVSLMRLVGRVMEKLLKVLTDPVSNRILQMIRLRKKMTIAEILAENARVPRATVYRKVERMLQVGAVYISDTNRIRGQIENVYSIKEMYIAKPESNEDSMKIVTISLMRILDLYERYFSGDDADVNRDKLFMLNYAIELSDSDFSDMMNEIFAVVDKYQQKQNSGNTKIRNLYLLSAPKGEEDNEK